MPGTGPTADPMSSEVKGRCSSSAWSKYQPLNAASAEIRVCAPIWVRSLRLTLVASSASTEPSLM